jgi:hypothetical protein
MSDEFQVSAFSVSGRVDMQPHRKAEKAVDGGNDGGNAVAGKTDDNEREKRLEHEGLVASALNKRSQDIAASIESEMRRMFPGTTVQAEVSFRKGSLLLEGSVVLVSWAGALVLEAARAEISEVLRVAFRRTITNALNDLPARLSSDVGAMEMTVTETRRPRVSPSPTPRESGALQSYAGQAWIPVLLLFLTALVLLLIADRFFVISTRSPMPIPQLSPTATPSPTTRNP